MSFLQGGWTLPQRWRRSSVIWESQSRAAAPPHGEKPVEEVHLVRMILDASLERSFRHVQLGGDHDAEPGHTGETTCLCWSGGFMVFSEELVFLQVFLVSQVGDLCFLETVSVSEVHIFLYPVVSLVC